MRVAVIIPYVKDRGYLDQAVESVKRQTYDQDKIQLILSQSPASVGVNLNNGIDEVKDCDIIRYLCDDDLLTHNSIKSTVEYFTNNPDVDFLHSNAINFWEVGGRQQIQKPRLENPELSDMLFKNVLHGGTVSYRSSCFKFYEFDESLWTGEEYDFNMMLLDQGNKLGYLDEITYNYRRHAKQKSLGNTSKEYQAKRIRAITEIQKRYQ